jgi:hypothetical protein
LQHNFDRVNLKDKSVVSNNMTHLNLVSGTNTSNNAVNNNLNKKTNCNLFIFHQNIQDLNSRKEALEVILSEIHPQMFVLTEHNMSANELQKFNLPNYTVSSYYSRTTTSGGGVAIFSERSFKVGQLNCMDIKNLCEDKLFECCTSKFKFNGHKVLIAGIYRTPQLQNSEFLNRLCTLLNILTKKEKHILVVGDFNINILNKQCPEVKSLSNILKSHGMYYLVDFPTRVTASTSTAIDNMLTNINKSDLNITGLITSLSDHDGQLLELLERPIFKTAKDNRGSNLFFKARNFSTSNMNLFAKLLEKETWFNVYNSNVDCKYTVFCNIVKYYFDLVFPYENKKKCDTKKQWINTELIQEKHFLINLKKLARSNGDKQLHAVVNDRNKQYKNKLVQCKKRFYDDRIRNSCNVAKATWGIIKEETNDSKKSTMDNFTLSINDHKITDPSDVSNFLNSHFINTVQHLLDNSSSSLVDTVGRECVDSNMVLLRTKFQCTPVDEKEIINIVRNFKNKASSGYDEIPIKLIKFAINPLLKPLVHLINSSFVSGIFPSELKISKIVPVHKKGNNSDPNNYRPVSLLPSISKIFEKAMYNRVVSFLEENNLFDSEQHGFRKGKSCVSALVEFTESVINSIDNGERPVGIFMDLSKAFDSISHKTLLQKLGSLGISGVSLNWFESYLSNRLQYVEIPSVDKNNIVKIRSNKLKVLHGVPQGSILGPLLFLCYLQGLPLILNNINNSKSELILYADDSNLIVSSKNQDEVEVISNIQLSLIKDYFDKNSLFLNTNKTNFITFQTKQNKAVFSPNIVIGEGNLNQITSTKFLGLEVDQNLSWDKHIDNITQKIHSGIYVLKRMSYLCSLSTLKIIYHAYIHSHIAYGLSVYGGTSVTNLNTLLVLQKRAIRTMLNLKEGDHVRNYFKELEILTIYNQYILDCLLQLKINLNKVTIRSTIHSYNTRNKADIDIQKHRLVFCDKKPTVMGTKFLKALPKNIQSETSQLKFKTKVKYFLLQNPFYSLNEFLCKKDLCYQL